MNSEVYSKVDRVYEVCACDAIHKIRTNFTKRNHDGYKCTLLILIKEFERIYKETLDRVNNEFDISIGMMINIWIWILSSIFILFCFIIFPQLISIL